MQNSGGSEIYFRWILHADCQILGIFMIFAGFAALDWISKNPEKVKLAEGLAAIGKLSGR